MPITEFWDCTPRDFFNRLAGWHEHEEYKQHSEWERFRWQTVQLMNATGNFKKNKLIKISDFKFSWEISEKSKVTPEDKKKIIELSEKRFGKKG